MDGFWVLVLKVAFLAILWLFIIIVTAVISSDMGGRRAKKRGAASTQSGGDVPSASRKKSKSAKEEPWILVIDTGSRAGDRLQLVPEVHIGRSPQCELVLDDDYVSGMHAALRHRSDGSWTLTDLGSTNGTFINTTPVSTPTVVTTRDVIHIGDVEMRLEAE
jgi:hypothetical protein